jgi:hypothetical protein
MTKTIFLFFFIFCVWACKAQKSFIVLKKGEQSIVHYWKDSHITFQLSDRQWLSGIITKITPDSFYFTQEIIRYRLMGADTLHFAGQSYGLADIYALPTPNETIIYDHDQVRVELGHEKFVWVRNGLLFQVLGGGYVLLNVVNDLISGQPPFAKNNLPGLGVGAAVFLFGEFLHLRFDPYFHIGKKYRLECVFRANP